ncbi:MULTISPECIES: flagellar basal body-associated FliL family protein [Ralstonia]|jgi:flagellar FliL protein|uniref:Flagellar protein FliL n=1 Tax=Ralstonia flaminis TaxID=3058597 RepID=A0ABM9K8B8_9RALS|nr:MULTISPECIES: flagellar basal body-associated FliL family protein [unclassified Ralstonia]CAJ0819431.1 hypothetical protein LMG18101_03945 [Ralstonia sp. LMG 18101]
MKKNLMIAAIAVAVVLATAGATAFTMSRMNGASAASAAPVVPAPARNAISDEARYVSLEKLVVMLRNDGPGARPRHLVMDLVFVAANAKQEKAVREQLPILRATAFRAFAEHTPDEVVRMHPDDFEAALDKEYAAAYGRTNRMPFEQVLVTKAMMD